MRKSFLHARLLLILLTIVTAGLLVRVLLPPYYNMGKLPSMAEANSYELFKYFADDPPEAFSYFTDRVIQVEGVISGVGDGYVTMGSDMRIVRCLLRRSVYDRDPDLKNGERVILKGVCRGLVLTEVLLTHCIVIYRERPTNLP